MYRYERPAQASLPTDMHNPHPSRTDKQTDGRTNGQASAINVESKIKKPPRRHIHKVDPPQTSPRKEKTNTQQKCASRSTTSSPAATTTTITRHPTKSSSAPILRCPQASRGSGTASMESMNCWKTAPGRSIGIIRRSARSVGSLRMRGWLGGRCSGGLVRRVGFDIWVCVDGIGWDWRRAF